jgi:hypothetical protein
MPIARVTTAAAAIRDRSNASARGALRVSGFPGKGHGASGVLRERIGSDCRLGAARRSTGATLHAKRPAGQAESACEKAATLDNTTWHYQVLLLAASAQNGDMQKAAVAKTELLKRQPGFSIAKDKAARLSDHPDYLKMLEAHYYPGLRKAGIPEK